VSRFQFELATPEHDVELRGILAATPTDGHVRVSFRREPSFFDAAVVDGRFRQILACRDRSVNRIAGFGSRSVTTRYVNGQATPVGYLSSLRALAEYRSRGLLARGYAYLRQLHADGRTKFYLTTIAQGNEHAIAILTSDRAGLPSYHFAGMYHTVAVALGPRWRRPLRVDSPVRVRRAGPDDLNAVIAFLNSVGPTRQFFPRYEIADFSTPSGMFRNLPPSDVLLAFRGDRLVGTLAGWDQSSFRQTVVEGYGASMRWARPLANTWARLRGRSPLPKPGEPLRYLFAALPVALDDDRQVFDLLLRNLIARASPADYDFVLVGLHADDPLLPVARSLGSHSYQTRLYLVCWDDGEDIYRAIDNRPPYLELGCL
jgi:hypothetical protein